MIPNKFQTQQHQQQQQQQQQQQHLTFNPIPSPSSDIKQQLPLKAYFLNKYEQLKNPASTSPLTSLVTSNSSTNNNVVGFTQAPAATAATSSTTPAVSLDNSVLSVLLADSNNQNLIRAQLPVGSSSVNLISPTLAMFQQQQSAHLHHHIHNQPQISLQQIQQQHAPMQQSYHIHGGSILQQQFDSRQPVFLIESKDHTDQVNSSFMQKGTPVMMNNTPSKSSKGGAAASSSNAKRNFSGSNSSLQNSDDEDDDEFMDSGDPSGSGNPDAKSKEEKRRLSHTAAEQKRRNAIKRGYDDLQGIVPSCDFMDPSSSQKVCKATVLKRSIDYIVDLEKEKDNHEKELDSLKKEIMALKIMKSNYDEILKYHQTPVNNNVEAAEETKFNLFVQFAENLFQSFNSSVNTSSFGELSASVMVNWLEQTCSMSSLKNIIFFSIYQTMKQMTH